MTLAHRRRAKAVIGSAVVALLLTLAVGCTEGAAGTDDQPASGSQVQEPNASAQQVNAAPGAIYLMWQGYPTQTGPFLVPVHRDVSDAGDLVEVLTLLAAGPTDDERAQGLSSALPDGTVVLGVTVTDGVATIDVNDAFGSGEGSAGTAWQVAQFVYTATRLDGVDAVEFTMNGAPFTKLGEGKQSLDRPHDRAGYADLLPPIAVERPTWGQSVGTVITIDGLARFEHGTVTWVLVDADGEIVVEGEIVADGEGATRRTFSTTVADLVAEPASLIVYDEAPAGSALGQVGVLQYPLG